MIGSIEVLIEVQEALMFHVGLVCQHMAQGQHGHNCEIQGSRRDSSASRPTRA